VFRSIATNPRIEGMANGSPGLFGRPVLACDGRCSQSRSMKRPHVLLVFLTRFEECTAKLKGIAHYERTHDIWTAFNDGRADAETDPTWIRSNKWRGAISRHATPQLANACKELNIPLVDLNDVEPFPGVPKIRPDNAGVGHMGAEHFIERGH